MKNKVYLGKKLAILFGCLKQREGEWVKYENLENEFPKNGYGFNSVDAFRLSNALANTRYVVETKRKVLQMNKLPDNHYPVDIKEKISLLNENEKAVLSLLEATSKPLTSKSLLKYSAAGESKYITRSIRDKTGMHNKEVNRFLKYAHPFYDLIPIDLTDEIPQGVLSLASQGKRELQRSLTREEFEIYFHLANHKGETVSKEELEKNLIGSTDKYPKSSCLPVLKHRLNKKLPDLTDETILPVYDYGYALVDSRFNSLLPGAPE